MANVVDSSRKRQRCVSVCSTLPMPSLRVGQELALRYSSARIAVCFLALLVLSTAASADTFVVSNTFDSGAGSLRAAILAANAQTVAGGTACARQRIEFAIPGAGPHSIRPLSSLPMIAIPMDIDGYSQAGASASNGISPANLKIEIDGSLAGPVDAFVVRPAGLGLGGCTGNTSAFRGLVINQFAGSAIVIAADGCITTLFNVCGSGGIRIAGNFIGTDVTGMLARGNGALGRAAIRLGSYAGFNIIGDQVLQDGGFATPDPALRNVISGNFGDAIAIASATAGSQAQANRIRGNTIGLNATATGAVANAGSGIVLGASTVATRIDDNFIAGNLGNGVVVDGSGIDALLLNNLVGVGATTLAFGNGGDGIQVLGGAKVVVSRSQVSNNVGAGVFAAGGSSVNFVAGGSTGNGGLGIDLAPRGVNANDPLDADGGPNSGLNTPIIDSVTAAVAPGFSTVSGQLQSEPNSPQMVVIYRNDACDPSGSGEGKAPAVLGNGMPFINVTTDAAGIANFSGEFFALPAGTVVTAIAQRLVPGVVPGFTEVSEFSPCAVSASEVPLFANGFE